MVRLALLLLVACGLSACGWQLRGTQTLGLPDDSAVAAVATDATGATGSITKQTWLYQLTGDFFDLPEQDLERRIRDKLSALGGVSVVTLAQTEADKPEQVERFVLTTPKLARHTLSVDDKGRGVLYESVLAMEWCWYSHQHPEKTANFRVEARAVHRDNPDFAASESLRNFSIRQRLNEQIANRMIQQIRAKQFYYEH